MKRLLILGCALLLSCGPNYSDGERVGVVTKLSRKGVIWKSWEGEMLMGGMKSKTTHHHDSEGKYSGSTKSMVANVFEFNVDPAVVPQVQAALQSGDTVRLRYRQWLYPPPWIENSHVIIKVEAAE